VVEVISGGWKLVEVGREGVVMYNVIFHELKIAHREIKYFKRENVVL
jgi:hypothetical protein